MYKFTFYFGCWAGVGVDYCGARSGGDCGNGSGCGVGSSRRGSRKVLTVQSLL